MIASQSHSVASCLREIDWLIRRLARLSQAYPGKVAELNGRIDGCLDERIRLMRLRDGQKAGNN